ncbi:MAG: nickel pincer cofactor biosynthesis protein LarC [Planctomycetota bacterium]|nr:nickel pincer cofactor biosynthesis protein LarC [Planctomycetota bacterium]
MRIAYFDPIGGAAGDMILAALLDAGLPAAALRREIAKIGIRGAKLTIRKEQRGVIQATRVDVKLPGSSRQKPVGLKDVVRVLEKSKLSDEIRGKAKSIFRRLAQAEAAVHGTTVGRVHLHEAGARDALIDVVGAVAGLSLLGVERVLCAPLNLGTGTVDSQHGTLPLPAPATVELLKGHEVWFADELGEHTTPTGAAILSTLCGSFGPPPLLKIEQVGYGAGTRDDGVVPNLLRVFVGEVAGPPGEKVWILETGIDDMNPEHYTHLFDRLQKAGALEVSATPTYMKKNRPGTLLRVVTHGDRISQLEEILLRETTTFGLRRHAAERTCLDRRTERVKTRYGTVRVKVGLLGGDVVTRSPEFEDCRKLADRAGVPLKRVYEAALRSQS